MKIWEVFPNPYDWHGQTILTFYNQWQNCWHIQLINPLFRHCEPFLPSCLVRSALLPPPPTQKQCCTAIAVILRNKQGTLNGERGVCSTTFSAVKRVVLVVALKVPWKDNELLKYVADCSLKRQGGWSLTCSLTVMFLTRWNHFIPRIRRRHQKHPISFLRVSGLPRFRSIEQGRYYNGIVNV